VRLYSTVAIETIRLRRSDTAVAVDDTILSEKDWKTDSVDTRVDVVCVTIEVSLTIVSSVASFTWTDRSRGRRQNTELVG
jgi:hypothetical protein